MSNLTRSTFSRFLTLVLLAALVISGLKLTQVAHAATQRAWTGAHPPTSLKSDSNWVGNVPPVAGDDLFFPAGPKRKSIRNNFPNQTSFGSLNFSGNNYNIRKISLTLTGGINTSNATGSNQISVQLLINGEQTFTSGHNGTTLNLNSQVNLNSNLLTVTGAGN